MNSAFSWRKVLPLLKYVLFVGGEGNGLELSLVFSSFQGFHPNGSIRLGFSKRILLL